MADEKKPGSSAEDIIEKLRLQMSRLDEAFGVDSSTPAASPAPEVEQIAMEEAEAPPRISTEELLRSLERTLAMSEPPPEKETPPVDAPATVSEGPVDGESPETAEALPETAEEKSESEAVKAPEMSAPSPSSEDGRKKKKSDAAPLEQFDFLSAFDSEVTEEEIEAPLPEEEETVTEDEDVPVFVKEEAPIVVHKESIEPETLITPEQSEKPRITVTETVRTPAAEAPKADADEEGETTFFVPAMPGDPQPSPSAAIPQEPRFDPTRYDDVLAAYERQREQVRIQTSESADTQETATPVVPRPPVIMSDAGRGTPVFDQPPAPCAEKDEEALPAQALAETAEEPSLEAPAETAEELPLEAPTETAEEPPFEAPTETAEEPPLEAPAETAEEPPLEAPTETAEEPPLEALAETAEEPPLEAPAETAEEPPFEAPTETAEEPPLEAPTETAEEPSVEIPAAEEPPVTPPTETAHAPATPEQEPPRPTGRSRINDAPPELRDTDRELRIYDSTGRVRLVSSEYRVGEELEEAKRNRSPRVRSAAIAEGEEDFMGELPDAIRNPLYNHPLGRPDRTKSNEEVETPAPKVKKKREKRYFHEETEGAQESDRVTDYVRHHLREAVHGARIRLIVIAVLAFMLLLFENITRISLAPVGFVDVKTAGFVDALLILGAGLAAWPRLRAGARGICIGRIVPESILLVELLVAFVYAVVYGILGTETVFFSFVPVLGLAVLYVFRVMQCETRRKCHDKLTAAGEKLVLSPIRDTDATEVVALREETGEEKPLVYRVRKAGFVDNFSERTTAVCEDERLNFAILIASVLISVLCLVLALVLKAGAASAVQAFLFSFFLTAPLAMLGVHIYAVCRTDEVAGETSAVVGELTVEEAVRVHAVSFEDIEAVPSSEVKLSNLSLSCDDPTTVFKYLTALYGHIGGPLCGRFSGMYVSQSVTAAPLVELVAATQNGVSAAIDGAEVVVGNGQHMLDAGITPTYDAVDEKVLADGKHGVLYVAVNGMICLKFYVEYGIQPDFERNALHLYRRGIAAILRTYDPNFTSRTVESSAAMQGLPTRVVGKKVSERGDFYTMNAESGLVTSESSATLLSLLLLCFRTKSALRLGWVYKLLGVLLGGALSVFLTLFGAYTFIPSVYPALYHLLLVLGFLLIARLRIRLPDITRDTGDKRKAEKRKEK